MILEERLLSFAEAAAELERRNGTKVHPCTLWRWARNGVQGVRLETRRLGRKSFTSLEALERFSKRLAELPLPERASPAPANSRKPRSGRQREQAIERAKRFLDEEGI